MINGRASVRRPRDASGQFAVYTQAIKDASARQASEFQAEVASQIQKNIKRPGATSPQRPRGRLIRATQDAGNRKVDSDRWRVGINSFMKDDEGKHYRTVEFGSTPGSGGGWRKPFTGTRLFGRWTAPPRQGAFLPGGADASGYRVKREIVGQKAYEKAWDSGQWSRRIEVDFRSVLGRTFGTGYGRTDTYQ